MTPLLFSLCIAVSGILDQGELFTTGTAAFEKKDYEAAGKAFSKIIDSTDKANPLKPAALYWRAQCHSGLKKTDLATADLDALLKSDADQGLSLLARKDYKALAGKEWLPPKEEKPKPKLTPRQQRLRQRHEILQERINVMIQQGADPRMVQHFQQAIQQADIPLPVEVEEAAETADIKLTDAERNKAQALIKQLGARSFKERKAAYRDLKAMGKKIAPVLEAARSHKDPEISMQARKLLKEL